MKKILLVMDSLEYTQQLEQELSGLYDIVSCHDGFDGIQMVKDFEPDVLIVDLMLSRMDGVSLLEHVWNGGFRPEVIAITSYISDYIVTALERMNVSCLLRGPCGIDQLVARIADVISTKQGDADRGREIVNILASLGFKMNTSGFRITQLALELFAADPNQKITTQLYPAVAACCNGTASQVEKAIRDIIDSAWKERNELLWRMYFPVGRNGKTAKPSNGEFLARITRCVMENDRERSKIRRIG